MAPNGNPESFGKWLKYRRKIMDLTQEQLGKLAGCSGAAIRKFEAEERKPSRELAELLARALQLSSEERAIFLQMARGIYPDAEQQPAIGGFPAAQVHENLPAPLTSLVDRIHDVQKVSSTVTSPAARWVTLVGPPGIGKTRLSIQTGRQVLSQFADGVWFVDLAPLEKPGHVLPAVSRVLAAIGLPPSPSNEVLAAVLKNKNLLLILDNFEHIPEAAVEIAAILKQCPGLKVLATSRTPLGIYGEFEYRVPPLSTPLAQAGMRPDDLLEYEAVQLLLVRIRQHQPGFAITVENAPLFTAVCALLDGLPLALELAAASLQRMTLVEMIDTLHNLNGESWIRQLSTSARDLPARQHTLENVVAWSYTLLSKEQQSFFCALSLFSGWFDLDAVMAVCTEGDNHTKIKIRQLLAELHDHSLLVTEHIQNVQYWRMLEVIREFASLHLAPSQRIQGLTRLAQHLQDHLGMIRSKPYQVQQTFYQINAGNIQVVIQWLIAQQDARAGFEMVIRLDDYWERQGYLLEGLELLKRLLDLPDPSLPALRVGCLQKASDLAWQIHDFERGLDFSEQAAELARAHNLQSSLWWHLNRLGRIYIEQGKYAEARQVLTECIALARINRKIMNVGIPLAQLGELHLFENRLTEAKTTFDEALAYLPEDDHIFMAILTVDMAEIFLAEGDCSQARAWLIRALPHASVHIRRTLVLLCAVAGYLVTSRQGNDLNMREAARLFGALQTLTEQSGVPLGPFYSDLNARRTQGIRECISQEDWQREFNAGQQISREAALNRIQQILAASDAPQVTQPPPGGCFGIRMR